MGPIAIRRGLERHRRRLAAIFAVLVCSGAIAAHHSGLAAGDVHHEMDASAAVQMCLAAFTAVGAAVVAVALGVLALGRWRPVSLLLVGWAAWAVAPPLPRARAGPSLWLLHCVSRR